MGKHGFLLATGLLLTVLGGWPLLYVFAFASMVPPGLEGWEYWSRVISTMFDIGDAGWLSLLASTAVACGGMLFLWGLIAVIRDAVRCRMRPRTDGVIMGYEEFDVSGKQYSDQLADCLRAANIRFEQSTSTGPTGRVLYAISVHPDDLSRAEEVRAEAKRQEIEAKVRTFDLVRRPYSSQDLLLSVVPNEDGYYASSVYQGEPFDPTRYRVVRGGWDHEHCYVCGVKVLPGEEWWSAHPANYENEVGICLDCHNRLVARGAE